MIVLISQISAFTAYAQTREFSQIGETFSRSFLNDTNSLPESLKRPALSVAQFGTSSAFYLQSQNGKHYFGTAAHSAYAPIFRDGFDLSDVTKNTDLCQVYPNLEITDNRRFFRLGLIELDFECTRLVAIFPNTDFAIFEATPINGQQISIEGISLNVPFVKSGAPLSLLSYSSFQNPGLNRRLSLAYSTDPLCQVISKDPLIKNIENSLHTFSQEYFTTPYIATGCDAAAGDSGAPLFNNTTGDLIGLLSGIPERQTYSMTSDDALISKLNGLLGVVRESLVWSDLTYVVPIQSIQAEILRTIETTNDLSLKKNLQELSISR